VRSVVRTPPVRVGQVGDTTGSPSAVYRWPLFRYPRRSRQCQRPDGELQGSQRDPDPRGEQWITQDECECEDDEPGRRQRRPRRAGIDAWLVLVGVGAAEAVESYQVRDEQERAHPGDCPDERREPRTTGPEGRESECDGGQDATRHSDCRQRIRVVRGVCHPTEVAGHRPKTDRNTAGPGRCRGPDRVVVGSWFTLSSRKTEDQSAGRSGMDVHDEVIPEETFGACLDAVPQVCVEVLLERDGEVLVARRTNEPAKDTWFWPGGRLYKGERLADCARRVGREELGVDVDLVDRVGVYSHFWDTASVAGADSRHTVNVAFHVRQRDPEATVTLDDQHDDYRFVTAEDPDLHDYLYQYFEDLSL